MYQVCTYFGKKALLICIIIIYISILNILCGILEDVAKYHLDPLFILQKKIIRKIFIFCYDKSSQFLLTERNILPLYMHHDIQFSISFMMYKPVSDLFPNVTNELSTTNDHIHKNL